MKVLFTDKARTAVISSLNESLSYPASNLSDVFLNRPYLSSLDTDTITFDAGSEVAMDSIYFGYCNAGFVLVEFLDALSRVVYSATVNIKRPIETHYFTQIEAQFVKITVDLDDGIAPWVYGYRSSVVIGAIAAAPLDFESPYPDNPAIADGGTSAYTATGGTWTGGVFTKTAANGFGNARLQSNAALGNGARITFFAGLTTKEFAIGFNAVLSGAVSTLDYALVFDIAGNVVASESGVTTALGTYLTTDRWNIFYDGNNIQYLKNGTVLRTVAVGNSLTWFFDSDWNTNGGVANTIMFRVGGQMYLQDVWATADSWSANGATAVDFISMPSSLRVTWAVNPTSTAKYISRNFTAFSVGQASVMKVRIRRVSGVATTIRIFNITISTTLPLFSGTYTADSNDWQIVTLDAQAVWTEYTGTVTTFRLLILSAAAGDVWDIDWIYIGDGTYILDSEGSPRKFVDGRVIYYDGTEGTLAFANSDPIENVKIKGVGFGAADTYLDIEKGYGPGRQTSTTSSRSAGGQVMRNQGPTFRSFNPRVPMLDFDDFRLLDEKLQSLGAHYPTYLDLADDTVYHEDPVYAEITDDWVVGAQNQFQTITIPFLEAK